MERLLFCLLCLVIVLGGEANQDVINQDDVVNSLSEPTEETQVVKPPVADADDEDDATVENEDSEDDDEGPFIYNVKRPTMAPPSKTCEKDDKGNCKKKDLMPYKKWKTYKSWSETKTPLFIIIFGGLRWDYLTPSPSNMTGMTVGKMKAFNWVRDNGVTISQINPVFPPYDLPVWTSMATGLYPKNHGVNGDYMFNLRTRDMFKRGDDNSQLDKWWIQGDPIWSVAATQGKKVSSLNWHNCTLPGKNIEIAKDCKPFNFQSKSNMDIPRQKVLRQLFNQAFTKIHHEDYDLSIVYTDVLKKSAKRYGPNSPQVMDSLAMLDDVLQGRLSDIKNKIERASLTVNVLVLSDYGLMDGAKTTKLVLEEYVNFDHVQVIIQRGGSVVLVPYALMSGDIMAGVGNYTGVANMVGVDAYVRDVNLETPKLEYPIIPEDLHYSGLTWTQDILLVAKPGFEIVINTTNEKVFPPQNPKELGSSGYHPNPPAPYQPGKDKHKKKAQRDRERKERDLYSGFGHMMKTIGFAWGPDFKKGYISDPIEAVDLYQLIAFLLQIKPNENDGSWDRVRPMLSLSSAPHQTPAPALWTMALLSLCTALRHTNLM